MLNVLNKDEGSVDFEKATKGIINALIKRSDVFDTHEEIIKFVYNNAIDDAANFARDMAKSNPQHTLAFQALEKEIRHWLTLR